MPKFTAKHYEAIARALKSERQTCEIGLEFEACQGNNLDFAKGCIASIDDVISNLADLFEEDNDRFKRDRFIEACGGEDE